MLIRIWRIMGAKTWMIVYSDSAPREALKAQPRLDRDATEKLAAALFPAERLEFIGDGDLSSTCPPDDELLNARGVRDG